MLAVNNIKVVEIPQEQFQDMLHRGRRLVSARDYELIEACVESSRNLLDMIELVRNNKELSIKKLQGMLFGASTEKTGKVLSRAQGGEGETEESKGAKESTEDTSKREPGAQKKKRKGHGRNGAHKFTGAERIEVRHPELAAGCCCPECKKGKVYLQDRSGVVLRMTGSPCVTAQVYEPQRLRCNLCGEVFTAPLPAEAGTSKYDETVASMIAVMKYGLGVPFSRLESLQAGCGVPLPASTQWKLVEELARQAWPAFEVMLEQAAQGAIVHNDDTSMMVLSLLNSGEDPRKPGRTGVYTTGIISILEGLRIALFFTGRNHAGENLAKVLAKRSAELGKPLQMCDGLSRNLPEPFETILSNCLAHGRRHFVDLIANFPTGCRYVLEKLRDVYRNDAQAKSEGMTPEQRLAFHQENSKKLMDELHDWMESQLADKEVEPNSGMGKAIEYMLKRWQPLTRFLEVAGAPLDNSICYAARGITNIDL